MSTPPSSLAWRRVSAQLAWPAARSASTAARPCRAGLRREPVVAVDPVGAERVERPVLQEDVDRLAERGGAGGQHRGGLELVVGAGEEDQVEGLVHGCHLDAALLDGSTSVAATRSAGCRRVAAETGQAPLENAAHDPAGDHHVGVGQPVADLAAVALGLDEARASAARRGAGRRWAGWRRSPRRGGRPRIGPSASAWRISSRRGLASVLRTSAWRIVISSMTRLSHICADAR